MVLNIIEQNGLHAEALPAQAPCEGGAGGGDSTTSYS